MATCPQCIGERKDQYSPLVSTIRYNRREGYMFCKVCGRRWALRQPTQRALDGLAPCDCEDPLYMELTGECETRCKAARQ